MTERNKSNLEKSSTLRNCILLPSKIHLQLDNLCKDSASFSIFQYWPVLKPSRVRDNFCRQLVEKKSIFPKRKWNLKKCSKSLVKDSQYQNEYDLIRWKIQKHVIFLLEQFHAYYPIDCFSLDQQLDRNIEAAPRTNSDNLLNKLIGPNGKCSWKLVVKQRKRLSDTFKCCYNLKLVSVIFYQIFIFSSNYSPSKTMKNVFYII